MKIKHHIRWRSVIFFAFLVIWPIVQFCIFYIGVNFSAILLAFQEFNKDTGEFIKWGFGNFKTILFDSTRTEEPNITNIYRGGMISLLTYILSVLISIPLGLFFSYYIGKKFPMSGFFRVVLFLPSIIPEIVLTLIYKLFMSKAFPTLFPSVGNLIDTVAGATPAQQYFAVMYYTLLIAGFGTSVLLYSNAMSKVSTEMLEAAKIDGAKGFTEFWHIVLPSVFPTIAVFITTGVCGIFLNQIHLYSFYMYAAPAKIQTYGYIMYHNSLDIVRNGTIVNSKASVLSAFGLLMTLVSIPLTFGVKKLLDKFGPSDK